MLLEYEWVAQKGETLFRKRFDAFLHSVPNSWFTSIQQQAIIGTPDKIGVINGFFIAIELKSSIKSKISGMQIYNLQEIVNAGGLGLVVHPGNFEDTKKVILKLSEMTDANLNLGLSK